MRAIVVYESMYGNTHQIADAIADGLRPAAEVDVGSIHAFDADQLAAADLVVVGGPTHVHGMSRESTRKAAVDALEKPDVDLELDPDAAGEGVREWVTSLALRPRRAAAFDTRVHMAPIVTGRASKAIAKELRRAGVDLVGEPESFLVTKETHLEPGELDRARAWGSELASLVAVELAASDR
jgi:hypothetical protein